MKTSPQAPQDKPPGPAPRAGRTFPLESTALFGGRDEILIIHGGETYRLRRTRQDKLILTK